MVEAQKLYDQVVARLGETDELSDHTSVGAEEVKVAEQRLQRQTHRLTQVLRYEPVLGVAVLACVGLMNVFAATLVPAAPANAPPGQTTSSVKPFTTTAKTTDGQFLASLEV